MKKITLSAIVAVAIGFAGCGSSKDTETKFVSNLTKIGTYETSKEAGSEIVAYDKISKRAFTTNGAENKIDIINLSDVASPVLYPS